MLTAIGADVRLGDAELDEVVAPVAAVVVGVARGLLEVQAVTAKSTAIPTTDRRVIIGSGCT
ncbi:MAG: hypothetical protein M3Y42_16605, partial [Actinomycetota bacterium]|nr:hypothetical protein [Actinomycetota bacterium]